jgi:hypothetical protein
MKQSSALRQLEFILDEAFINGDLNQAAGPVLLKSMKLEPEPQNLTKFYAILFKSEEETRKLKNNPKINRDIVAIEELQAYFISFDIWRQPWAHFYNHIKASNILGILNSFAIAYHSQYLKPFLEEDFLVNLNSEFTSLQSEILGSDLPRKLKSELINKIEDILSSVRNYLINGTEGLGKAVESLLIDLEFEEKSLTLKDRQNPVLQKTKTVVLGLVMCLRPSFWDVVGLIPDLEGYWLPKHHELIEVRKKIEPFINEKDSLRMICKKISDAGNEKKVKPLRGKPPKQLQPSKDEKLLEGKPPKQLQPGKDN